jgi:hypothetical protein
MDAAASPRSSAYADAESYMHHLGDSDDAASFRLLMQIRQEEDPHTRVNLLNQAMNSGLEFTLPDEQNLTELRAQAEADVQETGALSIQGQDALAAGDYDEARRLFRRVMEVAVSDTDDYRRAERYVRHLGASDDAEPLRLLMRIRQEKDARKRVDLLTQAQESDLEFTLPDEQRLETLLGQAKAEIHVQQEREAQALIDQGDEARRQGELERASELYQQALSVPDIAALREKIKKRVRNCKREIRKEVEFAELLSQAEEALSESHYGDAQDRLKEAGKLRPGDPRLEEPTRRTQEGADVVAFVVERLKTAQQQEEVDLWQVSGLYDDALAQAQEWGLRSLATQAQAGKKRAEDLLTRRAAQADGLVKQAEAALAQKDLDQALQHYEDALKADPRNEAAQKGKAHVEPRQKEIKESERLKESGRHLGDSMDWAAAIQRFRRAKEKNPDDTELDTLIRKAEHNKTVVEAGLDTIKSGVTPYATQSEMENWINQVAAPVMDKDLFTDVSNKTRRIFRREATPKLRRYIETVPRMASTGDFAGALQCCQEADVEWRPYLGSEQEHRGDIPALRSRLKILEAYRADLELADQAWSKLQKANARASQALTDGKYEDAVKTYHRVLRGLENSPNGAYYLLGKRGDGAFTGVWETSRQRFLEAARGLASRWEDPLRQAALRAETRLMRGDPQGASEVIGEAKRQADKLKRVKRWHDKIETSRWPLTESPWEAVDGIKRQVDNAIKVNRLLAEAREHLSAGRAGEARSCYEDVEAIHSESRRAVAGLEEVDRLDTLIAGQKAAAKMGDLDAERDALDEILRIAPRWEWAEKRLSEAKAQQVQERKLDAWRSSARIAKSRPEPTMARRLAQQVLKVQHDGEMQQIVTWADLYRTGKREREDWKKQARSAVREGRFDEALNYVARVLAQNDQDVEAQRLGGRAQHAIDLVEEARGLMRATPPDYAGAVRTLSGILSITGGAQEGEWADLLDEAQAALADIQDIEDLLKEIKAAATEERWLEVLRRTGRIQRKEPRARRYFRKAARAVREMVASAVEGGRWSEATRCIQALRAAGIADGEIQEWELQCERSDLLRRAGLLVEQGIPDELKGVIAKLDQFLVEHPFDRDAAKLRRQAQIAQLHQEAELAAQAGDQEGFEGAEASFKEALRLKPDAGVKKALRTRLDEVSVELALIEADDSLRTGDEPNLRAAVQSLEKVKTKGDARVRARLDTIKAIRGGLSRAADLEQRGKILEAAHQLDEVLRLQSDFPPALAHRRQLIDGHLNRGRQAEATGDLWAAREAYEILREISPQEHTNLEDIRRGLDGRMSDLAYRARKTLENPDLEQSEVEGLLRSLESIPRKVLQTRTTLNAYIPALRKRFEEVRKVDDLYQKAELAFDEAHHVGEEEYTRIQHLLDSVRGVNGLFARRTRVRELQRGLNEHSARRSRVAECIDEYRKWWMAWTQRVAPVGADFPEPVQAIRDEGAQLTDRAMELNREIKSLDDRNIYGLRKRDPSAPDPLEEEHDRLAQQRTNLENIADLLLDGIRQRSAGDEKSRQAQRLYDESGQDGDYKQAKELWEQAVWAYDLALSSLKAATAQYHPLSKRAEALVQDATALCEKVEQWKEEVKKNIVETTEKLSALTALRTSAGDSYGRREWFSALADYEEILRVNPRDSEAIRRKRGLERKLQQEDVRRRNRQRRWLVGIAGGIVVAMALLAGWYFVVRPGDPTPAPTPTPTQMLPTGTIARPTATAESPHVTETPVALTPTSLPITEYEPARPCIALRDTWVYQQPDETGSVTQSLDWFRGFSAIGETNDGKWLLVQLAGHVEPLYVLSADAQCTTP